MLKPGDRVGSGRYEILSELGSGGFGETYIVRDTQGFFENAVLKRLQVQSLQRERKSSQKYILEDAKQRFKKEAEILRILGQHEQIPEVYDCFEDKEEFYILLEFINGVEFTKELKEKKTLTENEVIKFLSEVLEILVFVHQHNIIHRDIKPSNLIRRDSDGKIFLIDFGAVKEINFLGEDSQGKVNPTVSIGTAGYTPPEQWIGNPKLSSDIYALGMICIQAITGLYPDNINTDENHQIIWYPLGQGLQVTPQLRNILDTMVRFNDRERYQTASHALDAVKKLQKKQLHRSIIYPSIGAIILIILTTLGINIIPLLSYKENNNASNLKNASTVKTKNTNPEPPSNSQSNNKFKLPSKAEVPFRGLRIKIGGSTTVEPISKYYKEKFEEEYRSTEIQLISSVMKRNDIRGSKNGLLALCRNQLHIAAISSDLSSLFTELSQPQKKECGELNKFAAVKLRERDTWVIFVHKDNSLTNLTENQVKEIFIECKFDNWSLLSQSKLNEGIIIKHRPKFSGTYNNFKKQVLGGQKECSNDNVEYLQNDTYTDYLNKMGKNEISYGSYIHLGNQDTIKMLSINNKKPESPNYPYKKRNLYYVYKVDDNGNLIEPKIRFFLGFALNYQENK